MTTETLEHAIDSETSAEHRISLSALRNLWDGYGACRGVSAEDMAYSEDASIGFNGMSKAALTAQRKYCGPCPAQE